MRSCILRLNYSRSAVTLDDNSMVSIRITEGQVYFTWGSWMSPYLIEKQQKSQLSQSEMFAWVTDCQTSKATLTSRPGRVLERYCRRLVKGRSVCRKHCKFFRELRICGLDDSTERDIVIRRRACKSRGIEGKSSWRREEIKLGYLPGANPRGLQHEYAEASPWQTLLHPPKKQAGPSNPTHIKWTP